MTITLHISNIVLMIYDIVKNLLDNGLTQAEVSQRANVPASRISEINNGKRKNISYAAGKRLEALEKEVALQKA